jgi:hypothetical protein
MAIAHGHERTAHNDKLAWAEPLGQQFEIANKNSGNTQADQYAADDGD